MSGPDIIQLYYSDTGTIKTIKRIIKTEEEWQNILDKTTFEITRKKGTEPAFSGAYYATKAVGLYRCACCGTDLFSSSDKYNSGTGWPSFEKPISNKNIKTEQDMSYGMERTEVLCTCCDAHLGHVFDDGPPPIGLRYCMNSAALRFFPGIIAIRDVSVQS